ncbi:MAG: DNA polymerase/3'-5' exonuclease PolX [Candidatus Micrarchaeia archaeon]
MENSKIAELFEEIADMLELDSKANRFEPLAYRKAALTIGTMQQDVGEIYAKEGIEGLTKLPGVGKTIAERIVEYLKTGKIQKYEELKKKFPIDFASLTKIQGMGAKKAYKLYKALGIRNLEDLKKAVEEHKIRNVEGFGEKSEEEIAKGIALLEQSSGRMLLGTALPEAETLRDKLLKSGLVERVAICGSTRRMRETVGDLDILVISRKNLEVMDFVTNLPEVDHIVVKGPTKTTVWLKIGLSCDFRVIEPESFGAAMQYFTGSKNHNIKLREIAIKKGYKLNEYGLFDKNNKNLVANKEEQEIYRLLGLDYVEPEMREDRGEIELAMEHKLPKLITLQDIQGDLHTHTNHTDGANTLEEMVQAAIKLGRKYIGNSDHSKSEHVAKGLDDVAYEKLFEEVDKLNEKYEGKIKILKSGEVDILKDGSLDLKPSTLEKMDYVIGAVHTNTNMSKEELTKRIVKALSSGYVDILAHPTGRLINEREPMAFDLDTVFQAAADNKVVMEINAFPNRLDLNDENILKARSYKLLFSIGTDSHRTAHLEFMRYGVGTARRGWLTKDEVINTYPLDKLLKLFKSRR